MKKLKNIFAKALLLSLILALCVGMTIGTVNAEDWGEPIYTQNFETIEDSTLDSYIEEPFYQFDAAVENGALSVKSNGFTELTFNDRNNINGSSNSRGITMYIHGDKISEGITKVAGKDIYYKGSGGDSTGFFEVTDKNGEKRNASILTTFLSGTKFIQTRNLFLVDNEVFSSSENNFKIQFDYYVDTDDDENSTLFENAEKKLAIVYRSRDISPTSGNHLLPEKVFEIGNTIRTWLPGEIEVADADFSGYREIGDADYNIRFDLRNGTARANSGGFYGLADLATSGVTGEEYYATNKIDPSLRVFISNVRVTCLGEREHKFDTDRKAMYIPFSQELIGDAKLSFDMSIPGPAEDDSIKYNSEAGAIRVGIADTDKKDVATVEVENTGSETIIYAISEDDNGEETKTQIYTGDVLDKNLNYTFEMDWKAKTYTVKITDGEAGIAEAEGVRINNFSAIAGSCKAKYLVVRHSTTGKETFNTIDNIKVYEKEDPDYGYAEEDVLAIDSEELKSEELTEIFTLPKTGREHDGKVTQFTWTSSDNTILDVVTGEEEVSIIPHRGEEDKKVTLTVVAELDGVHYIKDYEFIVPEHESHKKAVEVKDFANSIYLPGEYFENDFELPSRIDDDDYDINITWNIESGGEAAQLTGPVDDKYEVIVSRKANDTTVKLIPSVTVNKKGEAKTFTVVGECEVKVAGLSDVLTEIVGEDGDGVWLPETSTDENGKIDATVTLKTPIPGEITFGAVVVDKETGEIKETTPPPVTVTVTSRTEEYTLTIEDIDAPGEGEEIKYYLWDANGVPLQNTAPTDVTGLKAEGKVRGIRLNWSPSKDDAGVKYYAIYRDGDPLTVVNGTTYLDEIDEEKVEHHEYKVVPVDTNALEGEGNEDSASNDKKMYYVDFSASDIIKFGIVEFYNVPGGSSLVGGEIGEKEDSYCAISGINANNTPKRIGFKTEFSKISPEDSNITIRITYWDEKDNPIDGYYNTASNAQAQMNFSTPTGTAEKPHWEKAVAKLTDARFTNATNNTNTSFGIGARNNGKNAYIKKVEVIQTELYE